jgi:hypothetical protein
LGGASGSTRGGQGSVRLEKGLPTTDIDSEKLRSTKPNCKAKRTIGRGEWSPARLTSPSAPAPDATREIRDKRLDFDFAIPSITSHRTRPRWSASRTVATARPGCHFTSAS